MSAGFDQLERGTSVLYGACGGVWVMTLFAPPTKPDMLLARAALAAMKRREPKGFVTLTWVLPEAGYRMDSDARHAAAEVTQEFDAVIRAQATLIEGSGFQAATVRAIIAGLDAMSRSSGSKRVFSDLPTAVEWCVARRAGGAPALPIAELTRSLSASRDSVVPRSA
jgi:hypothetical protein